MKPSYTQKPDRTWRKVLHEVIFEADTPAGKWFDVILILSIVLSVIVVMLDSIASVRKVHGNVLYFFEWFFTILFTIEYIFRLISVGKPLRYATSFFGIIDLLAILPTYLSLIFPGSHYLIVIRVLRVLRIFRVLKLVQYLAEAKLLMQALRASRRKITVFLFAVLTLVIVLGSFMYIIEGEKILGYSIIAVPTGIMSVEIARAKEQQITTQVCPECSAEGHDSDALFCKYCGAKL
jgi:voltage-gated potassium channel